MGRIKRFFRVTKWYSDLLIAKIKHPKEGRHTQMCIAAGYELADIDEQLNMTHDWYAFKDGMTIEEKRDAHCEVEISYWEE